MTAACADPRSHPSNQAIPARDLRAGMRIIWPSGWITIIGKPWSEGGMIRAQNIAGSAGSVSSWRPDESVVIRP